MENMVNLTFTLEIQEFHERVIKIKLPDSLIRVGKSTH
jgi:hypothetical protein